MVVKIKPDLNNKVISNFAKVRFTYLIPSFLVLLTCFSIPIILKTENNYSDKYISIQKEVFFTLNSLLSSFPHLEYNLTQLGDVIILLPFVAIFIHYAPKLWEAIITSSILSLITSAVLKKIFSVPRPAAVFDNDSFMIIGKTLKGNTSLPSGHSMTSFIVITLLLFAFMPKKKGHQLFFIFFILTGGFIITFSRVGVGAHYPLDVIIGSIIGYVLAIIGIQLSKRLNWLSKLKNKYQNIILIVIILTWIILVIQKIIMKNLLIAYLALIPLLITVWLMKLKKDVQKEN